MIRKRKGFYAPPTGGKTAKIDPVDTEPEFVVGRFSAVHRGRKTVLGEQPVERSVLVLRPRHKEHVADPEHGIGVEVAADNRRTGESTCSLNNGSDLGETLASIDPRIEVRIENSYRCLTSWLNRDGQRVATPRAHVELESWQGNYIAVGYRNSAQERHAVKPAIGSRLGCGAKNNVGTQLPGKALQHAIVAVFVQHLLQKEHAGATEFLVSTNFVQYSLRVLPLRQIDGGNRNRSRRRRGKLGREDLSNEWFSALSRVEVALPGREYDSKEQQASAGRNSVTILPTPGSAPMGGGGSKAIIGLHVCANYRACPRI